MVWCLDESIATLSWSEGSTSVILEERVYRQSSSSEILSFIREELDKPGIIPRRNYLFIDDGLSFAIKNNFYLKEVTLEKDFPDKLIINVIEKVPAFVFIVKYFFKCL